MKFIDEAVIKVQAGNGGSGCRHFHREKFVPLGGPDGGNGGKGGSIVLMADRNKNTLLDLQYQPHWKAENGGPGQTSCRSGKNGADVIVHVPVGTQVLRCAGSRRKPAPGELLADLCKDQQTYVLAQGGRGGKGNAFFKSPTNRAPEEFQPGEKGQGGMFLLSLKLMADVGLIGLPNAGKSTLISRISAARPKIADYPFTTLVPNLGVVAAGSGRSFVAADIPGLIPGAHQGKGLGLRFLKHIERTRVLAHLIDLSQFNNLPGIEAAQEVFRQINQELELFSPELAKRPQVVVLTKLDIAADAEAAAKAADNFKRQGYACHAVSAVTGAGIPELINMLAGMLEEQNEETDEPRLPKP